MAVWYFLSLPKCDAIGKFSATANGRTRVYTSVTNPGFSRNPVFFDIFYYPKPVFFSTTRPGYFKNPGIAVALVILITLKLQIGACNGQISTFELSAITRGTWCEF